MNALINKKKSQGFPSLLGGGYDLNEILGLRLVAGQKNVANGEIKRQLNDDEQLEITDSPCQNGESSLYFVLYGDLFKLLSAPRILTIATEQFILWTY